MPNTDDQITGKRFMLSLGCCIQAATLLISYATSVTKQDTWIAVLAGFIIMIPVVLIYSSLGKRFPGRSIVEISDLVVGKVLGKIMSVCYMLFMFLLLLSYTRVLSDFIVGAVLPETPAAAILILFMFVCVVAARNSVSSLTNHSVLFIFIASAVLIINIILSIKDFKVSNFLPVFTLPIEKYVQGTHAIAMITFSSVYRFLIFLPSLTKTEKLGKYYFGGLAIGAATMLLLVFRDIGILGSSVSLLAMPSYEAIRQISIGTVLTRVEVLYAITIIILHFFQISTVLYATAKGTAQLFGFQSYKQLVSPIGVLAICFALLAFNSTAQSSYWGSNVAAVNATIFIVILPAITLIVAMLRGFRKVKESKT